MGWAFGIEHEQNPSINYGIAQNGTRNTATQYNFATKPQVVSREVISLNGWDGNAYWQKYSLEVVGGGSLPVVVVFCNGALPNSAHSTIDGIGETYRAPDGTLYQAIHVLETFKTDKKITGDDPQFVVAQP